MLYFKKVYFVYDIFLKMLTTVLDFKQKYNF
jgi:hypothetical protein